MRDGIDRIAPDKSAHRQRRDDRRENERPENLHRDRAEHDLGDEERSRDRRIVSRRDSRRRAATDEQAQSWSRPMPPAPRDRRHERRQLDEWTFAPNRSARSDREHGREAFHQAAPGRDLSVAQHHRLHVIGRRDAAPPAHPEKEHQAREQPADRRDRQTLPPREFHEAFHQAGRRAACHHLVHLTGQKTKPDRSERAAEPDQCRPRRA